MSYSFKDEKEAPIAGILMIGNEVLEGIVQDTNSHWIEQQLTTMGVETRRAVSVRDEMKEIENGLKFLLDGCSLIISSGGLGPTHDDITLKAIADFYSLRLVEDEDALRIVKRQYRKLFQQGIIDSPGMTKTRKKMATIPRGSVALNNEVGGSPGVKIDVEGKTVFCLPGVPQELKFIWNQSIEPWLLERLPENYSDTLVEFPLRDETVFALHSNKVMDDVSNTWIKSMPKQYGTTNVLRVWISSRAEDSITAERNVQRALKALEKSLGLESTRVES